MPEICKILLGNNNGVIAYSKKLLPKVVKFEKK